MKTLRYAAWRFLYPGVDEAERNAGLRIDARGRIDMVQGNDSVRQSILLLISTIPGERVMRPDYGCLIHRLIFSPNDDTTAGLAIYYVRSALERWEPRIDILRVDANRYLDSPDELVVLLEYRVRATQALDQMSFAVNLRGGEG